jgi:hypothetical protein
MQGMSEVRGIVYFSKQLTVSRKGSPPSFDWATTVQNQNPQLSELAHPKDDLSPVLLLTLDLREGSTKQLMNKDRVVSKRVLPVV